MFIDYHIGCSEVTMAYLTVMEFGDHLSDHCTDDISILGMFIKSIFHTRTLQILHGDAPILQIDIVHNRRSHSCCPGIDHYPDLGLGPCDPEVSVEVRMTIAFRFPVLHDRITIAICRTIHGRLSPSPDLVAFHTPCQYVVILINCE